MRWKKLVHIAHKLYDTDYLLKTSKGEFLRFSDGDFIIYGEENLDEEVLQENDSWVKTTELPIEIKNELIEQCQRRLYFIKKTLRRTK